MALPRYTHNFVVKHFQTSVFGDGGKNPKRKWLSDSPGAVSVEVPGLPACMALFLPTQEANQDAADDTTQVDFVSTLTVIHIWTIMTRPRLTLFPLCPNCMDMYYTPDKHRIKKPKHLSSHLPLEISDAAERGRVGCDVTSDLIT